MSNSHTAEVASSTSSTSSQQLCCRKVRKISLCVTVSAVGILLSLIATWIVLVVNNHSDNADDGSAAAALGSSMGRDKASNDQIDIELSPNSPSRTKAPTQFPTYSPTFFPTYVPTTNDDPLTFYAVGDVPYSDMEACLLPHELGKLSTSKGKFLVHLGDIRDGRSGACPEATHRNVARIFESSPLPALFVIGDNEWLDCGRGAAADESFARWEEHLRDFHERDDLGWPPLGARVSRHPDRPEMFAFLLDGVLFLGQGLPLPRDENMPDPDGWRDYMWDNAEWTRGHFAENDGRMRAAVIFGHSSELAAEPYFADLKGIASSYERVPILFLEDYHWFEDETFRDVPNLYRIALDDTVTPTSITVDTDATGGVEKIFRSDRRCQCSNGHRPTRLMAYTSGDCEGACDTNDRCAGENVCGTDGATCQ